jgi:hypothetical protein
MGVRKPLYSALSTSVVLLPTDFKKDFFVDNI